MKTYFLFLALMLGLHTSASAKVNVVATTPDLGAIIEAVGGTDVEVTCLARGTEDPHFVDARPSFIRLLNKTELLVEGGADLEIGWLPPLVNNARNARILPGASGRFVAAENLALMEVPTGKLDRSQGDVHPYGNPHYLLDPELACQVADALATRLSRLDPERVGNYRKRAESFVTTLRKKNTLWKKRLTPYCGTRVVTYHKSFDYFLKAFGLELAGTVEPKPGVEPSAAHLKSLVAGMKTGGVRLVIAEPNRPARICQRVAREGDARLLRLPLLVGGATGCDDYFGLMEHNVAAIERALR
ncbi:MAG: metal ABC transporter substrate-binding protein [Puniceicoccales bacterium]|jgi:ABC-type Zn uptake system ZnuABC Zn-binding protein ZnuA|nr:metal ABC transporter substrate-binding protein [Puniceicoccales bacterium]